ncbi:uncharacterized protein LOC117140643 [Drosophila mauritiana]|uniref:Uncharacterized protein LOC117140643 n=1 Tax=Drosophila mauritiana TaxID=7226 RepID=A0A6P8K5D2_DROMA|nr:uncharacterized protein LOC117140643 [Drosophila mauritiana]
MDHSFPSMPPNMYPEWSDARTSSSCNGNLIEPKLDLFFLMRSYPFPLPPLHSRSEFRWSLEGSPLSDDEKRAYNASMIE